METGSDHQKMQCKKSEATETEQRHAVASFSGCARDGARRGVCACMWTTLLLILLFTCSLCPGVAPLLRWGRHNAGALGFLLRVVTLNRRLTLIVIMETQIAKISIRQKHSVQKR